MSCSPQGSRSFLLTPAPHMTLSIPSLPPFPPAKLLNLCGFLNSCPSTTRSSISASTLTFHFAFLFRPKGDSPLSALLLKSPACAPCQPNPTRSHRAREPTGTFPAEDPSPCLFLPAPAPRRVDKSGQGRVSSTNWKDEARGRETKVCQRARKLSQAFIFQSTILIFSP